MAQEKNLLFQKKKYLLLKKSLYYGTFFLSCSAFLGLQKKYSTYHEYKTKEFIINSDGNVSSILYDGRCFSQNFVIHYEPSVKSNDVYTRNIVTYSLKDVLEGCLDKPLSRKIETSCYPLKENLQISLFIESVLDVTPSHIEQVLQTLTNLFSVLIIDCYVLVFTTPYLEKEKEKLSLSFKQ